MLCVSDLITIAEHYQAALGIEAKTLSFRVFGDSKKLTALKAGADITTGRFNSVLLWFSANWPEGLDWPAGIERPAPVAAADGGAGAPQISGAAA